MESGQAWNHIYIPTTEQTQQCVCVCLHTHPRMHVCNNNQERKRSYQLESVVGKMKGFRGKVIGRAYSFNSLKSLKILGEKKTQKPKPNPEVVGICNSITATERWEVKTGQSRDRSQEMLSEH